MGHETTHGHLRASIHFAIGVTSVSVAVVLLGNSLLHIARLPAASLGPAALAVAAAGIALVGHDLPSFGFQVPRLWNNKGLNTYALLFGATFGLGVLTRVASPGTYFALVAAMVLSPVAGVLIALAYASGRSFASFALAAIADQRGRHVSVPVDSYRRFAPVLALLEMVALGWIGVAALA